MGGLRIASNKIASITDGTSNTIALGEIANGLIPVANGQTGYNIWAFSGYNVGESGVVASMYGVNLQKRLPINTTNFASVGTLPDSPGHLPCPWELSPGANVGMADGSAASSRKTIATFPATMPFPRPTTRRLDPGPIIAGVNTHGMFAGPMPVFNAPLDAQ